MFTIGDYKIVFRRRWHLRTSDYGNGRYDTVCEICVKENGAYYQKPKFTGIAKLHPNDKPDKIVGKKIALRNAIGVWIEYSKEWQYNCADFYNKPVRTAIWTAFWTWVSSWPVSINWELHNRAHGSTSVKAKVNKEMRRLHKTTVWKPPASET